MPRIVFKKSEHPPVDLHEAAVLGRSEQHAHVVIKDSRLSRAHCRFEPRDDGTWAVLDLDSQNGTFLNGRRVKEGNLKPGDIVTIGVCDILFEAVTGPGGSTVMKDLETVQPNIVPPATATLVAPAALALIEGTLKDQLFPITHDEFTIGRKPENHLVLDGDAKASANHAVIRREGAEWVIADLGSRNGVLVNGVKIDQPVLLKTGQRVTIGQQVFEYRLQGKPNVSSGKSAPPLANSEVRQIVETEAAVTGESRAHEKAALAQKTVRTGGGVVFGFIEVVVVAAIALGVLYTGWTMLKDDAVRNEAGAGAPPPSRAGGLLAVNPSFDERDDAGFAKGWRYEVHGTDTFALVEGARGGPLALQISRFTPANAVSYAVSAPVELGQARGIRASAFAINSEAAVERFGAATVAILWFAHMRDREPILVTPVAFRTRLAAWTELGGAAAAPEGAKAFSIGVGLCGGSGSVSFDEVTVSADDQAERWWQARRLRMANGMTWDISEDGSISLSGADGTFLRGGRVTMHQVDGRRDPLDALSMLSAAPVVQQSDASITAAFEYFDPLAAIPVRLNLELGADGPGARFAAGVAATAAGPIDAASRRVALHVLATPDFAPAELARFDGEALVEYAGQMGVNPNIRATIGTLLASNTGTGNRISASTGTVGVVALIHPQGRELFLQANMALPLVITPGERQDELAELAAAMAAVQPGEDQVERVGRALQVFERFPYCQPELALAAGAIDSAAKDYRLRLIELRDGINVPQLTRNEQLYRAAMQQAIQIAARLHDHSPGWGSTGLETLRRAGHSAMTGRTRQASSLAVTAMTQLIEIAADFEQLAQNARRNLFLLEIDIQQRDSEAQMVSARDFVGAGQYVQGMLKLRAVVRDHPRCLRGIEAKERLVDISDVLLNEMEAYRAQGLSNIATDRALLAREQLRLVESQMLTRIMTGAELAWLSEANFGDGGFGRAWLEREEALMRRLQQLAARLPADLPEGEGQ